jgi:transposase
MKPTSKQQRGLARVQLPQRDQVELQMLSLDEMLEKGHRARIVWRYAESIDLSDLYADINAVEGQAGRPPIDPRILFALWLLATLDGVSSAREVDRRSREHIPSMWICGNVKVNYHTLSDFRSQNGELLERLLIDSIGTLLHEDLITLETLAQDGMRVRASAGSSSFRRQCTLEQCLSEAESHLEQLKREQAADPDADSKRSRAAAERAARERLERIKRATETLEELRERRKQGGNQSKSEPRASTTDPEATNMKMGDGGFRPAFNVQFASDGESRLVVGVDVSNSGSDRGKMAPLHQEVCENYDVCPQDYLVDGGFTSQGDITQLETKGTRVIGPISREAQQLAAGKDPYAARAKESEQMGRFRSRMKTAEAKAKSKQRAGIAEFPNADCRNRGLTQFRVRGLVKVKAQALWNVLAFNLMRMLDLGYLETVMSN